MFRCILSKYRVSEEYSVYLVKEDEDRKQFEGITRRRSIELFLFI
jgi:hypothetical protein